MISLFASTSRRALTTSARALNKAPLGPSAEVATPADLLAKIGRNADKKLADKAESWDSLNELWKKGSAPLGEAGLTPKERKYVLWAFSRYSQVDAPSTFIHAPKPPKKFRG